MNPLDVPYHILAPLVAIEAMLATTSLACILLLVVKGEPRWRYLAYVYELPLLLLFADFLSSKPVSLRPDNVWYWSSLIGFAPFVAIPLLSEHESIRLLLREVSPKGRRRYPLKFLLSAGIGSAMTFIFAYVYFTVCAKALDVGLLQEKQLAEKVAEMQRAMSRRTKLLDVGYMFSAELNTLAGEALSLPDALLGKIVVIHFWATWCPPSVAEFSYLRTVHGDFKDRGVHFVGITLDYDRKKVDEFVRDNQIPWAQTFTGKGLIDPTAQKYGVRRLPTIFVIGTDGRILSRAPGRRLEEIIDKALKTHAG